MIPVNEAQTIILEQVRPMPPRHVGLGAEALGLALAEEVYADADSPPFDKAMMDGYAVRVADLADLPRALTVIEEVTAGRMPARPVGPGQATRIMTGAPLPPGANAVVMLEHTRALDEDRVEIQAEAREGQNILPRGQEMRLGQKVLSPGDVLRPQEIGLLGSVGRGLVKVRPRPLVTILSTGDEIVEVDQTPGPGQIRNSNGVMLLAQVQRGGGVARSLLIVPDDREPMRLAIRQGLEQGDAVVLSGGVSAGKLDLVPEVLRELGVTPLVHKVRMKPGKPMYFGVWTPPGDETPRYVFGLPGNPVSSLVCFELFVRPALRKMRGLVPGPCVVPARLEADFAYRTDRPTYHPARLELRAEGWCVRPVPWFGSPDLRGVAGGNAFLVIPDGDKVHRGGETYPVLRVDDEWI